MVEFGLSLPLTAEPLDILRQTRMAQIYGFDWVFFGDHIISMDGKRPLNMWDAMAFVALQHDIGLASKVANINKIPIPVLIQHIDTLVRISEPRNIIIGLGSGGFDAVKTGNQADKMIYTIRSIREVQPDVPIFVAATGKAMKSIASRRADGWIARHALSPKQFNASKPIQRNQLFEFMADIPISFTEEDRIWTSLKYRAELEGITDTGREVLSDFSAIGDEDYVIKKVREYVDYGATIISVRLYDNSFSKMENVIDEFK